MFLSIYKKKLSSQILNYFFGNQTIKLKYGHKSWFFGKVFWDFKKWTKKMSKNENPKKLCQKIWIFRPYMCRDPFWPFFSNIPKNPYIM